MIVVEMAPLVVNDVSVPTVVMLVCDAVPIVPLRVVAVKLPIPVMLFVPSRTTAFDALAVPAVMPVIKVGSNELPFKL